MVDYYELEIDGLFKYFLVDGDDAVEITVVETGKSSTVGTHADIMDEVSEASEVSESDIPDDVLSKLERGADNLL
jgi:hypothetical protein